MSTTPTTIEALKARVAALEASLAQRDEWARQFVAAMDIVCGAYQRCTSLEFFERHKS
jgi:hypothetical protein